MNVIAEMLRGAARKPQDRRVGIEIERLAMWKDGKALRYLSQSGPDGKPRPGAEVLLNQLHEKNGWELVLGEKGRPIGMKTPLGKVSLEPGSQLELSTEPLADLFSLVEEIRTFEQKVSQITDPWGLVWMGLGVNPANRVDEIDLIPAVRYEIMTKYLPQRGRLATSMMRLTTSIQINLDYTSEAEAIEMLRVALIGAPISYALFANSPIAEGKPTGNLSYRNSIWNETDPDRTGLLTEVLCEGYDFDSYARMIWNRPLMFAQNTAGQYLDVGGHSLAQLDQGAVTGVPADERNQMNGIRELFTEARLKPGYVEVRSIDGLRPADREAATAFWVGLLYNTESRRAVVEEMGGCCEDPIHKKLLAAASLDGLDAKVGNVAIRPIAETLVVAAQKGLERRGLGEEKFLEPIIRNLRDNLNPAQRVLDYYRECPDIGALIEYAGQHG
jgi:glutamate--cysteine ligase